MRKRRMTIILSSVGAAVAAALAAGVSQKKVRTAILDGFKMRTEGKGKGKGKGKATAPKYPLDSTVKGYLGAVE